MSVSSRLRDLRVRASVRGVLIVKTLNKCILSSLVSNLVFDRQCIFFAPSHAYDSCVSRCEEKTITWTMSCVNYATVSLLKTPALSMELNFELIEDGEFISRCLQILLLAMPRARQRHADDTLTMYIR